MISLWQLCRPLFSLISTFMSYSVCRDKNMPLISGPHWGNFSLWSSYPSSFKKAKQPSSERDLNSKSAAIRTLLWVVAKAVGPYLPENWWNTLNIIRFTSCSKCLLLIRKIAQFGFVLFTQHILAALPAQRRGQWGHSSSEERSIEYFAAAYQSQTDFLHYWQRHSLRKRHNQ